MFPARSSAFLVASAAFFPHFPSTSLTDSTVSDQPNQIPQIFQTNKPLKKTKTKTKNSNHSLLTEEGAGAGAGDMYGLDSVGMVVAASSAIGALASLCTGFSVGIDGCDFGCDCDCMGTLLHVSS